MRLLETTGEGEGQRKTAFCSYEGLYKFESTPFGLVNAQTSFHRALYIILSPYKWNSALAYLDDIIAFSYNLLLRTKLDIGRCQFPGLLFLCVVRIGALEPLWENTVGLLQQREEILHVPCVPEYCSKLLNHPIELVVHPLIQTPHLELRIYIPLDSNQGYSISDSY